MVRKRKEDSDINSNSKTVEEKALKLRKMRSVPVVVDQRERSQRLPKSISDHPDFKELATNPL